MNEQRQPNWTLIGCATLILAVVLGVYMGATVSASGRLDGRAAIISWVVVKGVGHVGLAMLVAPRFGLNILRAVRIWTVLFGIGIVIPGWAMR